MRIIAGEWRGRRWRFAHEEIRPTPDRVRETLFNWLQGHVALARCLDLFAGSGALGLEALSRGAAQVDFIDSDLGVVDELNATLRDFGGAARASVQRGDALQWLRRSPPTPYDLVFIDPPYAAALQSAAAAALQDAGWLRSGSLIYVEQAAHGPGFRPPEGWQTWKSGAAGEVSYHLYRRE